MGYKMSHFYDFFFFFRSFPYSLGEIINLLVEEMSCAQSEFHHTNRPF